MNPGDLRIFLKAAQTSGLAAAERALGLPKASATRHVRRLEAAMGCALVDHGARRFTLTEAGHALLALLAPATPNAQAGRASDGARTPPDLTGVLRIRTPQVYLGALLPVLDAFSERHPGVTASVVTGDGEADLAGGEIDLLVRPDPEPPLGLELRTLFDDPVILVASPTYVAVTPRLERVVDLEVHRLLDKTGGGRRTLTLQNGRFSRAARVRPIPVVGDIDQVIATAEAGQGIAVVTRSRVAQRLAAGRLVQVLPAWRAGVVEVAACFRPDQDPSGVVSTFVEHAVRAFA